MGWNPLNTPLPVITRYGYLVIYNTERLTSIFNVGFGDIELSDIRIGANAFSNFNFVEQHQSYVPPGQGDRTLLDGYASENWPGNRYPDSVQSIEGGALEHGEQVENEGWIKRTASRPGRYVQFDIAGRLFRQTGEGIENLSCEFEAHYMTGGGWVAFPFSPMAITSGSTRVARETFSAYLDVGVSQFRVRRLTPNPTDANEVSDFECSRIKVFRDSDALYPAQRRLGTMIKATGQISGAVDRLSAFVRTKCWRWMPASPWTAGVFPGGAGWSWGHTVNPAWLFLYYARGGFLRPDANTPHMGQSGWLDEPSAGNGMRLFGAGVENARIDYATIVAWAQFCDAQGLKCRMVVSDGRSAGEVLDDIAAAGRATKTWATGKLGVVWEAAGQPVVATFGMSNIVAGTFKVSYLTDDDVDEFELSYTRSDDDYEPDTVTAVVPGVALPVNRRTETAVYSMPQPQAQRLVNLLAASEAYHRRTIQFETNAYGNTVQRGDIVHLGHDLTRWAFSGRLVGIVADNEKVLQVELSSFVERAKGEESLYLQVQPPGGDPFVVTCVPPAGRTRILKVQGVIGVLPGNAVAAWGLANAPGWTDATDQNAASAYPDTIPEDWTYLAGPTATPGKRCRIIGMEPGSVRRIRMTLRDEYEAYYPLEWGLAGAPAVESGERRIARAFNPVVTPAAAGGWLLQWELDAAHGADVFVSVNGGASQQVPIRGHVTVAGREILLPAYPTGTSLYIEIRPVAAGTPVAVEGCNLSFTADGG